MTPSRIKRIDDMKSDNRTLIWSWGDGIISENRFAVSSVRENTGIARKLSPVPQRLFMMPTARMNTFMEGRSLETTIGGLVSPFESVTATDRTFSPAFEVNDPDVTVLATHIDTGQPTLAIRDFFRWDAIYSSSPAINPEIIRAAALNSGAHVYYYKSDPIRFSRQTVTIHARSSGKRALKFDDKTPLFEVFSGLEFKPAKSHHFKVTKGKTYLFYRGVKADWAKLLSQ